MLRRPKHVLSQSRTPSHAPYRGFLVSVLLVTFWNVWVVRQHVSPEAPRGFSNGSPPHSFRPFQAVLQVVPFRGVQVLRSKRLILLHEKRVRRTAK